MSDAGKRRDIYWLLLYAEESQDNGVSGTCYLELAYRLIESSPTLRREWFGKR